MIFNGYADGKSESSSQQEYINSRKNLSAIGIDLDVTYISREPRYGWDTTQPWPNIGENVTFKAHIINKGSTGSGVFDYEWRVDDQILSNGSGKNLQPQEEAIIEFNWEWQMGRHFVGFEVDPSNLIPESAENNNKIEDATDAMTIGFWVEETVYNDYNNIQNGVGTYSWEDWAQNIIHKMNWMFEYSKYPSAPNGALTRVRLDNITIVPDGTLFNQGPWHAPYDTIYDGRWGFSVEEYGNGCQCCSQEICYDMPRWVIHELMHYLFARIDLYALDVQGGDVKVKDKYGNLIAGTPVLPYIKHDVLHYAERYWDMMHSPDNLIFSDYTVYSLNFDWPAGVRSHRTDWEHYFLELPSETKIRILDNDDQPIKDVQVAVYQAVPGDGSSGPYSQHYDNIPDITGETNIDGIFSIGGNPFGDLNQFGTPVGVVLIRLTHPTSGQDRYVWLEVSDLNMASWSGHQSLYIHDIHFPNGAINLSVSENVVEFTTVQGSNPAPKYIEVEIRGEGVKYWSIDPPTETWTRTIPDPVILKNVADYPPGKISIIIESSELQIGSYSTDLFVYADGIIGSPQKIKVNLHVEEGFSTYLPLSMRDFFQNELSTTIYGEEADGEALNNPCSDWDTCRSATNGTSVWQGLETGTVGSIFTEHGYMIARPFLFFDTSTIPSNAVITEATLNIYAGQWQNGNKKFHVVKSSASLPLSVEDFSKIQYISGGSRTPSSSFIWMQIPLNSSALNWIKPGDMTQFALVHDFDFRDITPTEPNDVLIAFAEDSEHKPYLSITYEVP